MTNNPITGKIARYRADVNTDDITKADLLKYNAEDQEGLRQLGLGCLNRLPTVEGLPFIEEGNTLTEYRIIIAGRNFGCGSSREQSPYALSAAGTSLVVAPSFAPIFWNNAFSGSSGLILRRSDEDLTQIEGLVSGCIATYDPSKNVLTLSVNGSQLERSLMSISERDLKLEKAGGILNYALQNFIN